MNGSTDLQRRLSWILSVQMSFTPSLFQKTFCIKTVERYCLSLKVSLWFSNWFLQEWILRYLRQKSGQKTGRTSHGSRRCEPGRWCFWAWLRFVLQRSRPQLTFNTVTCALKNQTLIMCCFQSQHLYFSLLSASLHCLFLSLFTPRNHIRAALPWLHPTCICRIL